MEQQTPLEALIAKYKQSHWEFADLELSDINQPRSDDDALIHLIACIGSLDEMDLLVRSGARADALGDLGFTALHNAAMTGRSEMAQKLLDLGANPSIKNEWGQIAETVAVHGGHAELAKLLRRNKYRNMQRNKKQSNK